MPGWPCFTILILWDYITSNTFLLPSHSFPQFNILGRSRSHTQHTMLFPEVGLGPNHSYVQRSRTFLRILDDPPTLSAIGTLCPSNTQTKRKSRKTLLNIYIPLPSNHSTYHQTFSVHLPPTPSLEATHRLHRLPPRTTVAGAS